MEPLPHLVTIPRAGKELSVSRRTVYRLIEDGKLERVYPRPRTARITSSSLTKYLERIQQPEQTAPRDSISQGIKARADAVFERFGLKKR
jgi:excisionase family DNA binding protein